MMSVSTALDVSWVSIIKVFEFNEPHIFPKVRKQVDKARKILLEKETSRENSTMPQRLL